MKYNMDRREFLKLCGICGMAPLAVSAFGGVLTEKPRRHAKSVIEVWLWGGASQLENFDPKPDAGYDYNGGRKAIPSNVPGIMISDYLPLLARQADKYSIIRSMTHGIFGHETATYMMQTGRKPGGTVFPAIGAVIGMMKSGTEYKGKIPPYIAITRPKGRFSEVGFLNPIYKPLVTGGDPNRTPFTVEGIVTKGITKKQHKIKRRMLEKLDTLGVLEAADPIFEKFDRDGEEAYDLIIGKSSEVFNLDNESGETRMMYGRNTFGQACLAARRLVEYGVPYIAINFNGWDTHKRHFQILNQKAPQLDQGLSALLRDLSDKKLLDSTIVWCCGEFGRKPKVSWESPWNGGRQHWGNCFSALVAG
ncbi:MAG: DUF1501 domain-containing protein, partial [Kiritimatiellaeota bacterium]|nr:DUF1501 domain-containing protein [Kiritimatiellota bacterium]